MSDDDNQHGRRSDDQLLPQFLQEIGAMRECVTSIDHTLEETRKTVQTIGTLATRTDGEFRSFRYTAKIALTIVAFFLTASGAALGYYFNQRDQRIEDLAGQMNTLTKIAIANQELNRLQARVDETLQEALVEALKAIRANQQGIRENGRGKKD